MPSNLQKKICILFSDTNPRAAYSLINAFRYYNIPALFIRSDRTEDVIGQATEASGYSVRTRGFSNRPSQVVSEIATDAPDHEITLIPTSEFVNLDVLEAGPGHLPPNFRFGGPDLSTYKLVTNKKSFRNLMIAGSDYFHDASISNDEARCCDRVVAIPLSTMTDGKMAYPSFVRGSEVDSFPEQDYFFERYLKGSSFYICGFVGAGRRECYWQKNLVQQSGGKSIIHATRTEAPETGIEDVICTLLEKLGYEGVFMAEFIHSYGAWYPIELNPRFWGPLRLGFSANPLVVKRYLDWLGFETGNEILRENYRSYLWREALSDDGNGPPRIWQGGLAIGDIEDNGAIVGAFDEFAA
jgi:hypothetical protein